MGRLLTCPVCKKEMASDALSCPHCGHGHRRIGVVTGCLIVGIVLLLVSLYACHIMLQPS